MLTKFGQWQFSTNITIVNPQPAQLPVAIR